MSRIYHNVPLSSLPVQTVDWKGEWKPSKYQIGSGILLEGSITKRSRLIISDVKQTKWRYFVFFIHVRRAHRRVFSASGMEIEPNFSETEKIRTGYLHSSYKTVAKGKSDSISYQELIELIQLKDLAVLTEKNCQPGYVALWIEEGQLESIELDNDDEVRIKTKGNGPFVESVAKLNAETSSVCNYAGGENVGASWTDKVMAVKGASSELSGGKAQNKDNEGAADDEWND